MKSIIKQIPNTITSLNLISGVLAILFAIEGNLSQAGVFICLAAIFDFLDGMTARLLKAYSEIGKQLDSLSDLVSFGVAPAAILFTLLKITMFGENQSTLEITANWNQWFILFIPILMPVLGALRLARFNAFQSDETFFKGLPIPANGIFWAAVGIIMSLNNNQLTNIIFSTNNLILLGILTSGMMVITMPMFSLKFKNFNFKENWYRFFFIILAIILLVTLNIYGLALTILSYIILNILFYIIGLKF